MFKILNLKLWLYGLGAALALSATTYFIGRHDGTQKCESDHEAKANQAALDQYQADLTAVQEQSKRASDAGSMLAQTEQAVRKRTQNLTMEVIKHVPIITDGNCRPNAELVRTWNAANRGLDIAPATASERNDTVP